MTDHVNPWSNPTNVETLKRMWNEGYACSAIAGSIPGVSRSAVIGKVHRLGLSFRTTVKRARTTHRVPPRKPKAKPPMRAPSKMQQLLKSEPLPPERKDIARMHLLDTDNTHCKFIIGEPAKGMCCGDKIVLGMSWCSMHARVVFQPPVVKDKKPLPEIVRVPVKELA